VFHLCHSSRKLTGAIWLISTPCTQISIFRRFQVCGDFYNDTKLIASWDTWGEHSIVRDTNQFLLLGSLVIFIFVWLFESIKNHWFQFLKIVRIREPPVPVVWKSNQNQRTTDRVISKTIKNHWFSGYNQQRTSSFMASYLIFQNSWELLWHARNWPLIFLRTVVMSPNSHPGNCWVSVPVSNSCPTLVIFLLGLLLILEIWLNNGSLK
jgi:hypothetical protein